MIHSHLLQLLIFLLHRCIMLHLHSLQFLLHCRFMIHSHFLQLLIFLLHRCIMLHLHSLQLLLHCRFMTHSHLLQLFLHSLQLPCLLTNLLLLLFTLLLQILRSPILLHLQLQRLLLRLVQRCLQSLLLHLKEIERLQLRRCVFLQRLLALPPQFFRMRHLLAESTQLVLEIEL